MTVSVGRDVSDVYLASLVDLFPGSLKHKTSREDRATAQTRIDSLGDLVRLLREELNGFSFQDVEGFLIVSHREGQELSG